MPVNLKKWLAENLSFSKKVNLSEVLWLSLGENCLPDDILDRHGLKGFSTPYSNGRSNLDYALALEKNNYEGLLSMQNLAFGISDQKKVVRSKLFNQCDPIYNAMHMKGFEMTHHNVIESEKARESFERKIQRQLEVRGKKNIVFLYHHRINNNSDLDSIFRKAQEFSKIYTRGKYTCTVIVFSQKTIPAEEARRIYFRKISRSVHFFEFHTPVLWGGIDKDIFFARIDDDLIKKMLDTAVEIIKSGRNNKDGFL
jgi:hypothetical protein